MEQTYFISVEECCKQYSIDIEFIDSLEAHGLLYPVLKNNDRFFEEGHLLPLEKFINMHYEMGINFEGIEVISRLLQQIETMQTEMRLLRSL